MTSLGVMVSRAAVRKQTTINATRDHHGHDYVIEVWISGPLDSAGMVVDLSEVTKVVKEYHGQNLGRITLENFAGLVLSRIENLCQSGPAVVTVTVHETDYSSVTVTEYIHRETADEKQR